MRWMRGDMIKYQHNTCIYRLVRSYRAWFHESHVAARDLFVVGDIVMDLPRLSVSGPPPCASLLMQPRYAVEGA